MKQLGVGILGCGKMGQIYANYFDKNINCRLAAFYNRTCSCAEALAAQYRETRVCRIWEEVVTSEDIDIVGICTPSSEHMVQMKLAIENGKHVLCEKPLARDINECRHIVRLTENYNKKVMIGFQMRFHPVIIKLDEIIKEVGDIYHMDFVFGMYRPEITWRHKIEEHGGVLKELASHLLDLIIHWAGPVVAVTGLNRIVQPDREVEDYSLNLIEFKNGVTGYLFSNYQDRHSNIIRGRMMGIKGQIEFQFSSYSPRDSKILLVTDKEYEIPVGIPEHVDEIYPGHMDSFEKEINHFIDCILCGRRPLTGCKEGMRVMEIIDASYESQRRNQKIILPIEEFSTDDIDLCFKKL